jgi:hypothetical protein
MSGVRLHRLLGRVCVLLFVVLSASANEVVVPGACFGEEVLVHVRAQFAKYGPRSAEQEYFGFIYAHDGHVESAVTSGSGCRGQLDCNVNPAFALKRIPKGARILGEWHTHPQVGSIELSLEDVNGAHANRHIHCYSSFYSTPDGGIFRWDIAATSVPDAMASRAEVGNYRAPADTLRAPDQSTANTAARSSGAKGNPASPACCNIPGSTANAP